MKIPTRQRLVEAAVRRFYRDGFRNVGIDQILADVGVTQPTIGPPNNLRSYRSTKAANRGSS